MPLLRGVGERLRVRLIELGYVRADGKPDVRRWCREKGYDKTNVYYWLGDRSTPMKELDRLVADLDVPRGWLLLGEGERPKPKRRRVGVVLLALMCLGSPSPTAGGLYLSDNIGERSIMSTRPRRRLYGWTLSDREPLPVGA